MVNETNTMTVVAGDRIRMQHNHLLDTITFLVTVVRVTDDAIIFRVPDRVQKLRFPPCGGQKYGKLPLAKFDPRTIVRG